MKRWHWKCWLCPERGQSHLMAQSLADWSDHYTDKHRDGG